MGTYCISESTKLSLSPPLTPRDPHNNTLLCVLFPFGVSLFPFSSIAWKLSSTPQQISGSQLALMMCFRNGSFHLDAYLVVFPLQQESTGTAAQEHWEVRNTSSAQRSWAWERSVSQCLKVVLVFLQKGPWRSGLCLNDYYPFSIG